MDGPGQQNKYYPMAIDYEKLAMTSLILHFLLRITCFVLGFLTIRLGYKLILQGAKGEFKFSGSLAGLKSKLESISPGLLFVLLGIILIGYGMGVKREVVLEENTQSGQTEIPNINNLLNDSI